MNWSPALDLMGLGWKPIPEVLDKLSDCRIEERVSRDGWFAVTELSQDAVVWCELMGGGSATVISPRGPAAIMCCDHGDWDFHLTPQHCLSELSHGAAAASAAGFTA